MSCKEKKNTPSRRRKNGNEEEGMAGSLDMYKDLLTPLKDPEKSFEINISELLENYVTTLVSGRTAPNFNSAALILQGSSSIYGKKVEYLHNLATKLCHSLVKQKKGTTEPQTQPQPKKEPKEREKKEHKSSDPFLSVELKLGKNLSCLGKKNTRKETKKSNKKAKLTVVPVCLLSAEDLDRGDLFYDTRGELVGNVGDYVLNRCTVTEKGWLLVSTVNPNLVPSSDLPAVCNNSNVAESSCSGSTQAASQGTGNNGCIDDAMQGSPDEGFGTDPASNDIRGSEAESAPTSQTNGSEPPTPNIPNTSLVDEGIVVTPSDDADMCHSPGSSVGIENVPAESDDAENPNPALVPVRHSVRQALKPCQLAKDSEIPIFDAELLIRRKIQKKNTSRLPEKLLSPGDGSVCCISEYCARTFFSIDNKSLKRSMLYFEAAGLDTNSKFLKRMMERIRKLKSIKRTKMMQPIEDEREVDVEEIECLKSPDPCEIEAASLFVPFDDDDVQINNNPDIPEVEVKPPEKDVKAPSIEVPVELPSPNIKDVVHEEHESFVNEVQLFVQKSDLTERVHEWERSVRPFLEELEQRESFDINLYGSQILSSFEDNNRKQTKTFRQFCKNKEKWEVHRYFMALLPLANVGNVSIESERNEDGSDEIFVTLLSRKMHHKELEEFGHNDGSHP